MTYYKATPPVEEITWYDHSKNHTAEWREAKSVSAGLKEHVVCRSVGMRVFEDDTRVTLASEARVDADWEEPGYSCCTTIYKALMIERRLLGKGTPARKAK